MHIGVDLLAMQSEGSRDRGVGRYAARLLRALIEAAPGDRFRLFRYRDLPDDRLGGLPDGDVDVVDVDPSRHPNLGAFWSVVADTNPDRLDALLILNPFELVPGYEPPRRPTRPPALISVAYDFIPRLFPSRYLSNPRDATRYARRLDAVRGHHGILAISESTRRDAIGRLGVAPHSAFAIGGASVIDSPTFGGDDPSHADRRLLTEAGIPPRFLLHVGGRDDRKNIRGVLGALAMLPDRLRGGLSLVVAGHYDRDYRARIDEEATRLGIASRLMVLGVVSQPMLEALYRRCAAFVFPSEYEGLGLPIIEAMSFGAPVIAGRNSAQVEVVGLDGWLVDPSDRSELAATIVDVLDDPDGARLVAGRGAARVARLRWGDVGARAHAAIAEVVRRHGGTHRRRGGRRADRERVAVASPFPPKRTGIADHAEQLARQLGRRFDVELVHSGDYVPDAGLGDPFVRCIDRDSYRRRCRVLPYAAAIYHVGNSWYHRHTYEDAIAFPGITVLHDYSLAGFHHWYASETGAGADHLVAEAAREDPGLARDLAERLPDWEAEPGGFQGAATRRGLHLNARLLERSEFVVVHSRWCRDAIAGRYPGLAERTVVVPLGCCVAATEDPEARRETRAAFGLPVEGTVFGCFGNLTSAKMFEEIIAAAGRVLDDRPDSVLLFVGKDWEDGRPRRLAAEAGIAGRVRFLGHVGKSEYERLAGAIDVGLGLRRPPTFGESSASLLDLLRRGVPTIVADAGAFAEFPDDVVRKWDPARDGVEGLVALMRSAARSAPDRERESRRIRAHLEAHHGWDRVVESYAELIRRRDERGIGAGHRGLAG